MGSLGVRCMGCTVRNQESQSIQLQRGGGHTPHALIPTPRPHLQQLAHEKCGQPALVVAGTHEHVGLRYSAGSCQRQGSRELSSCLRQHSCRCEGVWGSEDGGMRGQAGCAGCRRRLGKEECQLLSQQLPSSACLSVFKCVGPPGRPLTSQYIPKTPSLSHSPHSQQVRCPQGCPSWCPTHHQDPTLSPHTHQACCQRGCLSWSPPRHARCCNRQRSCCTPSPPQP